MRVKILVNVGRDILDLLPVADQDGRRVARGLFGANLVAGEIRDMDDREAELLKRCKLAEDAPPATDGTSPAALAKKAREG